MSIVQPPEISVCSDQLSLARRAVGVDQPSQAMKCEESAFITGSGEWDAEQIKHRVGSQGGDRFDSLTFDILAEYISGSLRYQAAVSFEASKGDTAVDIDGKIDTHFVAATRVADATSACGALKTPATLGVMCVRKDMLLINIG